MWPANITQASVVVFMISSTSMLNRNRIGDSSEPLCARDFLTCSFHPVWTEEPHVRLGVMPDFPRGTVSPTRLVPHVVVYCVVQSAEYPADVYRRQHNHLQTILVDTSVLPVNPEFI